jgi:hypothetical protein
MRMFLIAIVRLGGLLVASLVTASPSFAAGESVNGFPNWEERVLHEWTNRARSNPQFEMSNCPAGNCLEAACYSPVAPLTWSLALNRAGRFQSYGLARNAQYPEIKEETLIPPSDGVTIWGAIHLPYC